MNILLKSDLRGIETGLLLFGDNDDERVPMLKSDLRGIETHQAI